jgi:hypothetical protein
MAMPCKQNGRSQRTRESAAGYSWGWKEERKPRKRLLDDTEHDLRKTGFKRWRIKAMDSTELRKLCEAAKVLKEL